MKTLAHYEIIEELGRGGFAVVYKARDTVLDRIVALKVLHAHVAESHEFVRRFKQEARTAAQFSHPHIVTIHEIGKDAGQHYIAMNYLPGRGLDKWLAETDGPLPLEQVSSIVTQVAGALDYIHRLGTVHRDVKPANVMLSKERHATLLDFGIVRAADGTPLTTVGEKMGTPQYMSPEQAEGREIDHRSDIYALGVMVYQMCTGQAPFDDVSPLVVLRLHADKAPPPPHELNADLPAPVAHVILKALAKRPDERYQSAGDFAQALQEALAAAKQAQQREVQLAESYAQLQAVIASEDWVAAEARCHEILAQAPGYRDVPDVLDQARDAQAEQKKRLAQLHDRVQTDLRRGRWEEAQKGCDDIELLAGADYGDVRSLRQQAEFVQQQAQAERERQSRLSRFYDHLQAAVGDEDWTEVLALGGQIQAIEQNYRDVSTLMAQAWAELRHPRRIAVPWWGWVAGVLVVLSSLIVGTLVLTGVMTGGFEFLRSALTSESSAPTDGDPWTRPTDGMVMVYVPGGTFQMGSEDGDSDEQPVHEVTLDGFWIDRTEVTNAQYSLCVADGDCEESRYADDADYSGDNYPVVGVSWFDAEAYCEWAETRLPTEAEWEYAARGPDGRIYPWGDQGPTCGLAQYSECSERTVPVGSFPDGASWCGALDMAGNVWEWVADWYGAYPAGPHTNPIGPPSGDYRVLRGGSWGNIAYYVRGANRYWFYPDETFNSFGFRCARGSD